MFFVSLDLLSNKELISLCRSEYVTLVLLIKLHISEVAYELQLFSCENDRVVFHIKFRM